LDKGGFIFTIDFPIFFSAQKKMSIQEKCSQILVVSSLARSKLSEARALALNFTQSARKQAERIKQLLRKFLPGDLQTREIDLHKSNFIINLGTGWIHVCMNDDQIDATYSYDDYFHRSNPEHRAFADKLKTRLNKRDANALEFKEALQAFTPVSQDPCMDSDWVLGSYNN